MADKVDRLLPDVEYEYDFLTLVGGLVDSVEEYGLAKTCHVLRFPRGHEFAGYEVTLSVEKKAGKKSPRRKN
jgi:hypothetical protein